MLLCNKIKSINLDTLFKLKNIFLPIWSKAIEDTLLDYLQEEKQPDTEYWQSIHISNTESLSLRINNDDEQNQIIGYIYNAIILGEHKSVYFDIVATKINETISYNHLRNILHKRFVGVSMYQSATLRKAWLTVEKDKNGKYFKKYYPFVSPLFKADSSLRFADSKDEILKQLESGNVIKVFWQDQPYNAYYDAIKQDLILINPSTGQQHPYKDFSLNSTYLHNYINEYICKGLLPLYLPLCQEKYIIKQLLEYQGIKDSFIPGLNPTIQEDGITELESKLIAYDSQNPLFKAEKNRTKNYLYSPTNYAQIEKMFTYILQYEFFKSQPVYSSELLYLREAQQNAQLFNQTQQLGIVDSYETRELIQKMVRESTNFPDIANVFPDHLLSLPNQTSEFVNKTDFQIKMLSIRTNPDTVKILREMAYLQRIYDFNCMEYRPNTLIKNIEIILRQKALSKLINIEYNYQLYSYLK